MAANQTALDISDRDVTAGDMRGWSRDGLTVSLKNCTLDGADLASLDMCGWTFEDCRLANVDFRSAGLEGARFAGCRGAHADFPVQI